ncbi:MAG: tetratricopeptide repeat protein [Planctomycetota bacterium]
MTPNPNTLSRAEITAADYQTLQQMGENYLSIGDYPKAKQCYEQAAVLAADEAAPYAGLGMVALQTGHTDDAEIAFRVACRLDGDCAAAYAGLGMIAQRKNDHERAFEMYLKCLELDTNNLTALLGLFQASSEMGSFAKVIHYLKVYLKLHPTDSSVMFCLAALYMKEAQFKDSKDMLEKILKLSPDNKDAKNLLEEVQRNLVRTR